MLVNCFKGSKTGGGPGASTAATAAFPPFPHSRPHPSSDPPALDEVVAHRVLPLFFRTLRLWSTLPSTAGCGGDGKVGGHPASRTFPPPSSSSSSPPHDAAAAAGQSSGFATVCVGYAAAVAAAINASMSLGSWQRQREAVAYGAVDSLVDFLGRARTEERAIAAGLSASSGSEHSGSRAGRCSGATDGATAPPRPETAATASGVGAAATAAAAGGESIRCRDARFIRAATRAGLNALATLCARCEEARERTIVLGFHAVIRHWLVMPPRGNGVSSQPRSISGGGKSWRGGSAAVLLAALSLARNLGRSSVACSALVAVGAHESLLGIVASSDNDGKDGAAAGTQGAAGQRGAEDAAGEGAEQQGGAAGVDAAADRVALASACLANMALEHEVVKEAVVGSEDCLRSICDSALDPSACRRNVGSGLRCGC